jgi:para-aminobenzoate synthetase / 4-amino-4-deoxychorismate lyase
MTIETIFNEYLNNVNSSFFYTPSIYDDAYSYLFSNPEYIITAENEDELNNSFDLTDEYLKAGMVGYGTINYEAGYYLDDKFLKYRTNKNDEMLRFCFFDKKNVLKIKSSEIDFTSGGFNKSYAISDMTQSKSKEEFIQDIQKIKDFIEEGDTYQVNYTMKCKFNFSGELLGLFKSLVFNQSGEYIAFINNPNNAIISLSPELFFSLSKNEIISKPMKGTIKRGISNEHDLLKYNLLRDGEKFHAENLMILDLIRNDIGKISKYNSVKVNHLYKIQKYESLFQLISEVRGELDESTSYRKIFESLFPCGSVTGAPKIRTMEIIGELEKEDRGLYTGSVGLFLEDQTVFNVAIRTIIIDKKNGSGEAGIGSGITWDSDMVSEYNETMLKSRFLTDPYDYFELFETMLVENGKVFLLDYHLERLNQSADYFMFVYDEEEIRKEIILSIGRVEQDKKYRLKLTLNKWGNVGVTISDSPTSNSPVKIIVSDKIISTKDRFRYFKTTNRKVYDDEYKHYSKLGYFDVIFFNEKNHLAEGAITNIFIRKGNIWSTPPLNCGILPGVYRRYFMEKNPAGISEMELTINDLRECDEIILTNSLRGEIKVDQAYFNTGEIKDY